MIQMIVGLLILGLIIFMVKISYSNYKDSVETTENIEDLLNEQNKLLKEIERTEVSEAHLELMNVLKTRTKEIEEKLKNITDQ